ncbi:MAG: hypothetical protein PVH63_02550 [Balneolaceae bacterium]|jgi:hypothetical protein
MKKNDNLVNQFIAVVRQSFKRLQREHTAALLGITLTTFFSGFVITGLLERLFYLPASIKITLITLIVVISSGLVIYLYKKLEQPTFKAFYHQFGKQNTNPRLSDALDLYFDTSGPKPPLHKAAIQQNLENLSPRKIKSGFDNFLKNHPVHRYYRSGVLGTFISLALLIGFIALEPTVMNRLTHPWISYSPPNPYTFDIEPGTITLEQGESFIPKIKFEGEYPENLSLAFKTDIENDFRTRNATSVATQEATFSPISLTANGSYYFIMDGFKSPVHRVTIQLRPRLEKLSAKIIPPSYTGLDTSTLTYPFSQMSTYRGTKIELSAKTNKPLSKISLFRTASGDTVTLASSPEDPTSFHYGWSVGAIDTASFNMSDSAGLSNKNKFRFVIEPKDDQYPFVNLVEPSDNLQMKTPENLVLEYKAGDDFGLTRASLHFELQRAFVSSPEKGSISLSRPKMNISQQYEWEIPALKPKPRDVLTYWIEVRDNDAYNGSKVGRSQKLTVTFPSMTKYMDELDKKEEDVTESLENVSDSFEQMQQEYDKFKNQLKRNPETDWEQKQQLQQVEEKRKEVDKKVEDLNKKFEEIRKEIQKNRVMSPETMKAYDELQKLMKQINDPELAKALEELRKQLGQMSPEQMRKALKNYEFNEEQYKERLNRTMELFKSLKLNSDLEKMAKSLEELAKQEEEISESKQSPKEDLEKQETVRNDLQDIRKNLEKLDKNAPKRAKDQVQSLKKDAEQQAEQIQKELKENMKQLQEQLRETQPNSQTKQQQRKIQQQMQQMAQQMRDSKQTLNQKQMQINQAALEYILYSLINLSDNQEELTKETEKLPSNSQVFVEKARKEQNIWQQFSMLSDSLYKVSSEIPSFSNQINKKKVEVEGQLDRAVKMLAERDGSNSTFAQRESLGGINQLSAMIASLLDQLQNQQGGGSGAMSMQQLIEQMQKMSGQQQKLNQQLQNMINDIQGDRLSQDHIKRLNQMARQQNNIRKQLQELQRNGELESGDQVLSQLERMSEQMEDAINDLRGGQLDRSLVQRQQNILSRMLSAEKAMQERGKEDRREATTAEDQPQSVPPDITLEELKQRVRKMLNDPNRTKFTEDYQRLIEEYFELLKKQKKEIIESE